MLDLGSTVEWTSAANGSWKKKTGIIIEVVTAKSRPTKHIGSTSLPRNHMAYVVAVGKTMYWPIASKLKEVK